MNYLIGWRKPARVRRRHRLMVGLRRKDLYLKEIALLVQRKYGGPLLDHTTIVYHLLGDCACARSGAKVVPRVKR